MKVIESNVKGSGVPGEARAHSIAVHRLAYSFLTAATQGVQVGLAVAYH